VEILRTEKWCRVVWYTDRPTKVSEEAFASFFRVQVLCFTVTFCMVTFCSHNLKVVVYNYHFIVTK